MGRLRRYRRLVRSDNTLPHPPPPLTSPTTNSSDSNLPPTKRKPGRPRNTKLAINTTIEDEYQQLFDSYITHLGKGKSVRSFVYRGYHLAGTWQLAEAIIKKFPDRFPKAHIDMAKAIGFGTWEEIVEQSAKGENTKANTATLQMLMRNRYDWDKQGNVITEGIEEQLKQLGSFFVSVGLSHSNKPGLVRSEGPGPLTGQGPVVDDGSSPA
jgi:hypothetical protein